MAKAMNGMEIIGQAQNQLIEQHNNKSIDEVKSLLHEIIETKRALDMMEEQLLDRIAELEAEGRFVMNNIKVSL